MKSFIVFFFFYGNNRLLSKESSVPTLNSPLIVSLFWPRSSLSYLKSVPHPHTRPYWLQYILPSHKLVAIIRLSFYYSKRQPVVMRYQLNSAHSDETTFSINNLSFVYRVRHILRENSRRWKYTYYWKIPRIRSWKFECIYTEEFSLYLLPY